MPGEFTKRFVMEKIVRDARIVLLAEGAELRMTLHYHYQRPVRLGGQGLTEPATGRRPATLVSVHRKRVPRFRGGPETGYETDEAMLVRLADAIAEWIDTACAAEEATDDAPE